MTRISLNGTWKLHVLPPRGDASVDEPDRLEAGARDAVPARVPGNVELDLERAGRLPDPFVGENIHRLRAYESRDWLYTTVFDTPTDVAGRDIRLRFHGLDCFATIWLNGARLGETDNMFVEHCFDVSACLAGSGRNKLAVHLGSAVNEARRFRYEPSQVALVTNYEQLHVRKAPHMYGWDITPRAVSAGIWRDVDLEIHEKDRDRGPGLCHPGHRRRRRAPRRALAVPHRCGRSRRVRPALHRRVRRKPIRAFPGGTFHRRLHEDPHSLGPGCGGPRGTGSRTSTR